MVEKPLLHLKRGKGLREFIHYKNRCLSTLNLQRNEQIGENMSTEIAQLLEQYIEVFEEPKTLPPERNINNQINLKPDA